MERRLAVFLWFSGLGGPHLRALSLSHSLSHTRLRSDLLGFSLASDKQARMNPLPLAERVRTEHFSLLNQIRSACVWGGSGLLELVPQLELLDEDVRVALLNDPDDTVRGSVGLLFLQ